MPVCNDLRLGGTLSASGITGGVSINNSRIAIADWSGIFGHVGHSYQNLAVAGRPGVVLTGDGLPLERFVTLPLLITRWNETGRGALTAPSEGAQMWDNTDLLIGYLGTRTGFYLEVDDPDGTKRFTFCYAANADPISQTKWRRITVALISPWPYWKLGGTEFTNTASGAGTITVTGNVPVFDPVITFSAAGTYSNTTAGWTLTTTGACVIDVGARTVQVGGVNNDNLLTRTDREWAWFEVGANTISRSVSCTTTMRMQYG